jgi:hypothetical protein
MQAREEGEMRPMRRTAMLVTVLLAAGAVALFAGNQLGGARPGQPNFETGPMPVSVENEPAVTITNEPTVVVTNDPIVRAQQFGEWMVTLPDEQLQNLTVVLSDEQLQNLTMPTFVQAGVTYTFVWPAGATEEHLVVAIANSGWVQVEGESGSLRWLNTSAARSIEVSASAQ